MNSSYDSGINPNINPTYNIMYEKANNCITIGNGDTNMQIFTDCIIFNIDGQVYPVDDIANIPLMLYKLIAEMTGINPAYYEQALKEKIFNEIIKDIGVKNERILKIEKIFNDNNK